MLINIGQGESLDICQRHRDMKRLQLGVTPSCNGQESHYAEGRQASTHLYASAKGGNAPVQHPTARRPPSEYRDRKLMSLAINSESITPLPSWTKQCSFELHTFLFLDAFAEGRNARSWMVNVSAQVKGKVLRSSCDRSGLIIKNSRPKCGSGVSKWDDKIM